MSVIPFESLFKRSKKGEELQISSQKGDLQSDDELIPCEKTEILSGPYKYRPVWKRMIFKAYAQRTLARFREEIMLYGTSNNLRDMDDNFKQNVGTIISKKLGKLESFRFVNSQNQTEKRKPYILYPDCKAIKTWSIILATIMCYTVIFMPFRLAFMNTVFWDFWTIADLVIDLCFFFDIIVNFFTPYQGPNFFLVTNLKKIACKYLASWFLLDIISCIPFTLIDHLLGENTTSSSARYNTMLRLFRLPRLYKLLKLFRVFKILKHYRNSPFIERLQDFFRMNSRLFKLFKFLMSICLCVHVSGCFWYFVARLEEFNPETWVFRHSLMDVPTSTAYIASIYWAFTTITTVGYGDIYPRTEIEMILTMTWMVAGVGFYSIVIGSLTSLMTETDSKESVLNAKLAAVQDFSHETQIPESSQRKMKDVIKFNCENGDIMWRERHLIFKELPKKLRYEVACSMYNGLASQVNFFVGKDPSFVTEIMPYFRSIVLSDEDYAYEEGDYADEVYIILRGRVNFVIEDVVYKSFLKGSYFGEIEIVHDIEHRRDSTQACGKTELLSIHRKDFLSVIREFPATLNGFKDVARERMYRNRIEKEEIRLMVFDNHNNEKTWGYKFDCSAERRVISENMEHNIVQGFERILREIKNLSNRIDNIEETLDNNAK